MGDRMKAERTTDRWLAGLVAFLIALVSVACFVGWSAIQDVAEVEKQDRETNRATAYRLCSRNAVDRAFAHSSVRRNLTRTQGKAAADAAIAELQRVEVLPILDCEPNLEGRGAAPMTPTQQTEFVGRYERGELTPEERGICPGSRLENETEPGRC